jgi:hypothetical protein
MGKSRLYAISLETGGAALWSDGGDGKRKYLEFDGVKIVSATEAGGEIIFGIAELAPTEEGKSREYNQNGVSVSYKKDMALILNAGPSAGGSSGNGSSSGDESSGGGLSSLVTSNDSIINYWLYK